MPAPSPPAPLPSAADLFYGRIEMIGEAFRERGSANRRKIERVRVGENGRDGKAQG